MQNCEKRGCELPVFYTGAAIDKEIPIFRPKLGVQTQFLVNNCMLLK